MNECTVPYEGPERRDGCTKVQLLQQKFEDAMRQSQMVYEMEKLERDEWRNSFTKSVSDDLKEVKEMIADALPLYRLLKRTTIGLTLFFLAKKSDVILDWILKHFRVY
jgi:hypothetical protein